jgi:LmbE family N-acetylglucosaminyl deacetylase
MPAIRWLLWQARGRSSYGQLRAETLILMKVLVIAPHPDDECLGCGGTAALHAARGDDVAAAFLTSGELGLKNLPRDQAWAVREREARAACAILGIGTVKFLRLPDWSLGEDAAGAANKLRAVFETERPGLIYLPHPAEWHPDHRVSLSIVQRALDETFGRPALRGYEVWTPMAQYDHVENISAVMEKKLTALREHASQTADWDYVRAVEGLNAYRGVMAGRCDYAEVFQDLPAAP